MLNNRQRHLAPFQLMLSSYSISIVRQILRDFPHSFQGYSRTVPLNRLWSLPRPNYLNFTVQAILSLHSALNHFSEGNSVTTLNVAFVWHRAGQLKSSHSWHNRTVPGSNPVGHRHPDPDRSKWMLRYSIKVHNCILPPFQFKTHNHQLALGKYRSGKKIPKELVTEQIHFIRCI
jgi:hypothetical protein